jgi:hypothetical protein
MPALAFVDRKLSLSVSSDLDNNEGTLPTVIERWTSLVLSCPYCAPHDFFATGVTCFGWTGRFQRYHRRELLKMAPFPCSTKKFSGA